MSRFDPIVFGVIKDLVDRYTLYNHIYSTFRIIYSINICFEQLKAFTKLNIMELGVIHNWLKEQWIDDC